MFLNYSPTGCPVPLAGWMEEMTAMCRSVEQTTKK